MNIEEIKNLYESGLSLKDISLKVGSYPKKISNCLKSNGVIMRSNSRIGRKNCESIICNRHNLCIGTKINSFELFEILSHDRCICKCICGTNVEMSFVTLIHNRKKSCGCQRQGKLSPSWKGYEDLSSQHFSHIKADAKRRSLEFSDKITMKFLIDLIKKQNYKCKLTGIDICLGPPNTRTASLDRVDSSKGYIKGNLQWVHKHVNIMKWSLSQTRFIEICKLVAINN